MRMKFGTSAFEMSEGDMPELPVINMYAVEAPTEETGIALQSRRGLDSGAANMGAGPVECLMKEDGVLSGALFGVSAQTLYRDTMDLGAISGFGPVSMAGNEIGLMVTAGTSLHYWDGLTLIAVAFPDAADVSKVFRGGSRFWMIRADTGKLYFTPALAATVDALDFITAESLPDKLLDGLWIDDIAVLFGAGSVEFWLNTGDPALPIQPLESRVFEGGIRATGCASLFGSTFAWVGNDNVVYLNGQEPQRVSNAGLEEKITASATCRLWAFTHETQEFLALTIDAGTWVFGRNNRMWSQFQSYGGTGFAAQCYSGGVFGSAVDGKTLTWGADYTDDGLTLERRFRGGFALNAGGVTVNNVTLRTNPGNTPYLSGEYADPRIEMRLSRNGGKTWGPWKTRTLGEQGEYRQRVQWRGLGMASAPGLLAEWRVSDPVGFRISDVLVNEKFGGR